MVSFRRISRGPSHDRTPASTSGRLAHAHHAQALAALDESSRVYAWDTAWQSELNEIGALVERGPTWELTYTACGHVQQLARVGLEDPRRAIQDIRRHYARCLLCARVGCRVAPG